MSTGKDSPLETAERVDPIERIRAVVIGASAGGLIALQTILSSLPSDFPWPIIVVQHLAPDSFSAAPELLASEIRITVREATDKEAVRAGVVYLAPPNYHLLVEPDHVLSLSVEDKVNFARPSIDVFFESASHVYGAGLVGVILTGANRDGAQGLQRIKQAGGFAIVQDPSTAEADAMPRAAIAATQVDEILPLREIGPFLLAMASKKGNYIPSCN